MRFLIIVIMGLTLTACTGGPPPPPANIGKYAPEVNPEPKHFMNVQGYIDPKLKNVVQLKIITTYSTSNPNCNYSINPWEGVSTFREINNKIIVKTDINGNYEYSIPLDLF